jgi:tetratricopeptide (TPR) repeat protein
MFRKNPGLKPLRQSYRQTSYRLRFGKNRSGRLLGQKFLALAPQNLIAWALIALSILILFSTIASSLWVPVLARIIPDRYVLAYAPESWQQEIFDINIEDKVPTPVAQTDASALLAELPAAPTPTSDPQVTATPLARSAPRAAGEGYLQPTPLAVEATPTVTPASPLAVDSRAVDRTNNADLSQAIELLTGFDWEQQGYNNCGPASLKTLLSYWGVSFTEAEAAAYLKPNPEDPNVRPDEMAQYAKTHGYETLIRVNGNIDQLKLIIAAGYPVMIETGYDPEPTTIGWTSHYLTLVGYTEEGFIAMDTYRRPNWFYPFEEVDHFWQQFNRRYLIFHRPDQAVAAASLVGENNSDTKMYENSRYQAQLELSLDRENPFVWFNLGSSLVGLGDYENAISAFNEARRLGLPWRFMWYQFSAYEAYLQTGAYDEVIVIADDVLARKASEEAYYYKGLALAATGDVNGARRQLQLAIRFNKNYEVARLALDALGDD